MTGSWVELDEVRCRNCRMLLGQVYLPAEAVVRIKCRCNVFTTVGGHGAIVTMLTRTRAEITDGDQRDAA